MTAPWLDIVGIGEDGMDGLLPATSMGLPLPYGYYSSCTGRYYALSPRKT